MANCFGPGEETVVRTHFIGHLIGLDFSTSPHLSGILNDAKQIRDRAFHYATQFFATVGRDQPVVWYLDDLHWADDGSLDFIEHVTRTCADVPLLICVFATDDFGTAACMGPGWNGTHPAMLQPLSKRESRLLVEEFFDRRTRAAGTPRLVVSGAEGNPFV